MEDQIKDAMITGKPSDRVLEKLINLVVNSINRGIEIFPDPMKEPLPFKTFRQWVIEGSEEAKIIEAQAQ